MSVVIQVKRSPIVLTMGVVPMSSGGGAVDSVDGRTGTVVLSDLYAPTTVVTTHVALADPHTQYLKEADVTATGNSLITAASASAARTSLGSTATGDAVFVSADALAARNAISVSETFIFGASSIGTTAAARGLWPGGSQSSALTTTLPSYVITRGGTLRDLYVLHSAAGTTGGSETLTYELYVSTGGGAFSATGIQVAGVAVTMASPTTASNTSNTYTVVAGDLLQCRVTKSGTITGSPTCFAYCRVI